MWWLSVLSFGRLVHRLTPDGSVHSASKAVFEAHVTYLYGDCGIVQLTI